jgi:hypothetical protein
MNKTSKHALSFFLVATSAVGFFTTQSSFAMPLLVEDTAQRIANEVFYPDSENLNLYYYMPDSVEFVVEPKSGLPEFNLTYWGLDGAQENEDSGAFMSFSVRLTSNQEQKSAMETLLSSGKQVARFPVENSAMNLSPTTVLPQGIAAVSDLFSEIDFPSHPGSSEDAIGVNAVLTPLGARVFVAAIDNLQIIKFDAHYTVQGLGPATNVGLVERREMIEKDFCVDFALDGIAQHKDQLVRNADKSTQ